MFRNIKIILIFADIFFCMVFLTGSIDAKPIRYYSGDISWGYWYSGYQETLPSDTDADGFMELQTEPVLPVSIPVVIIPWRYKNMAVSLSSVEMLHYLAIRYGDHRSTPRFPDIRDQTAVYFQDLTYGRVLIQFIIPTAIYTARYTREEIIKAYHFGRLERLKQEIQRQLIRQFEKHESVTITNFATPFGGHASPKAPLVRIFFIAAGDNLIQRREISNDGFWGFQRKSTSGKKIKIDSRFWGRTAATHWDTSRPWRLSDLPNNPDIHSFTHETAHLVMNYPDTYLPGSPPFPLTPPVTDVRSCVKG